MHCSPPLPFTPCHLCWSAAVDSSSNPVLTAGEESAERAGTMAGVDGARDAGGAGGTRGAGGAGGAAGLGVARISVSDEAAASALLGFLYLYGMVANERGHAAARIPFTMFDTGAVVGVARGGGGAGAGKVDRPGVEILPEVQLHEVQLPEVQLPACWAADGTLTPWSPKLQYPNHGTGAGAGAGAKLVLSAPRRHSHRPQQRNFGSCLSPFLSCLYIRGYWVTGLQSKRSITQSSVVQPNDVDLARGGPPRGRLRPQRPSGL